MAKSKLIRPTGLYWKGKPLPPIAGGSPDAATGGGATTTRGQAK